MTVAGAGGFVQPGAVVISYRLQLWFSGVQCEGQGVDLRRGRQTYLHAANCHMIIMEGEYYVATYRIIYTIPARYYNTTIIVRNTSARKAA